MTPTSVLLKFKQHTDSFSQEQLRAVWPLCRMPTMLPRRGRLPATWNHFDSCRATTTGQRVHRTTMHTPWATRLHDGWGQTLWMQTLSTELQPKKQKFLFWCRLSFDGALCGWLARCSKRFERSFSKRTTSYIPARKKRPRVFEKQPRSRQDVLRPEENTQHCKFQQ